METVKFLVTGCAGFIGGHMMERLIAEGFEVVGVDNFSTGKRENLAAVAGRFKLIEGDLCDPDVAARATAGVTHVIHLASIPSVPRSIENPGENMQSSVVSTVTLLHAAVKAGVKRVVQASSSAVYGNNETSPLDESQPPLPLSPYAAAKMAQEHYGVAFFHAFGLDSVAMRYFNVFGPRQDPKSEYAAVIPKFIVMMLAGERPGIFGDGGQTRDFIHVADVAAGNLAAALAPGPLAGRAVNLAGGAAIDLNQLVNMLNAALGTSLEARHLPPRAGEVRHSLADISAARRLLGFSPSMDFASGLAAVVDWFRCGAQRSIRPRPL